MLYPSILEGIAQPQVFLCTTTSLGPNATHADRGMRVDSCEAEHVKWPKEVEEVEEVRRGKKR